ncbi:MAG TPA: NAD(P)-dependent oxidoreductase [Acidimicrobiales bacterium]|nr:NAD(P)-dependent oxidoreductase [Acidimicrobiales bacterium]
MLEVGVIGLGNIGGNLAVNLVADGHSVTVYDVDAERMKTIEGATPAGSIADLARRAEVTLTSLPDPATVTAVAKEWAAAAPKGAILCDLSTTLPGSNQAIARELANTDHVFVEAPLSGGAIGAKNRGLVFMIGGDEDAVAQVKPLLDALGRATFHLGPIGAGTTMKLATSLMAFSGAVAALEALSLTTKAGIDVRTASDIVKLAGPTNYFLDRAIEGINTRGKPTEFALRLAAKDARLIGEIGEASGVPTVAASAVLEFLSDAVARGFGDNDWSDLVLAAEARGDVSLTIEPKPQEA